MLANWEREHPGRIESIFSALRNVEPARWPIRGQFDFAGLRARPPCTNESERTGGRSRTRRLMRTHDRPLANSYWVVPGSCSPGEYPYDSDDAGHRSSRCSGCWTPASTRSSI